MWGPGFLKLKVSFHFPYFGEVKNFFCLTFVFIKSCIPLSVIIIIVNQSDIVFRTWLQEVKVTCFFICNWLLAYYGITAVQQLYDSVWSCTYDVQVKRSVIFKRLNL